MAAGIRVDIDIRSYSVLIERDPECLNRLCRLIELSVEEALYNHAKVEISPDCYAVLLKSIVRQVTSDGLGSDWTNEKGSETEFSEELERTIGMGPTEMFDDGAKHIFVSANFS